MKKNEQLTLIDGSFSHTDAKEILSNIISSKINFHEMKNWSSQERSGKKDAISIKRITELREEIKKLESILKKAKAKNKTIKINSKIILSLEEE